MWFCESTIHILYDANELNGKWKIKLLTRCIRTILICNRSSNDNNYNKNSKIKKEQRRMRVTTVEGGKTKWKWSEERALCFKYVTEGWLSLCIFGDKNPKKTNLCAFVKKIERQKLYVVKLAETNFLRLSNVFFFCKPQRHFARTIPCQSITLITVRRLPCTTHLMLNGKNATNPAYNNKCPLMISSSLFISVIIQDSFDPQLNMAVRSFSPSLIWHLKLKDKGLFLTRHRNPIDKYVRL